MIIGILGGGQLARMIALAGYPLGLRFVVLDPAEDACASQVATHLHAPYDDRAALRELARRADIVTFDFENVPAASARLLAERVPLFPPPAALAVAQDRLSEKKLFGELGIETAPYAAVDSLDELKRAIYKVGLPAVLKTRRLGYDGKGQRVLRSEDDAERAWPELCGKEPVPLIVEGFIEFDAEVSMLAARSAKGELCFYPLTANRHESGILRFSRAPALGLREKGLGEKRAWLEAEARRAAQLVLSKLDYVGMLAIEFFLADGRLIANEMAPRVHNSGHWTQDGAAICQFENHLRAGLGQRLGDTATRAPAAMVNLIGSMPEPEAIMAVPGAHLHAYGKSSRPGRKVGHVNVCRESWAEVEESIEALLAR